MSSHFFRPAPIMRAGMLLGASVVLTGCFGSSEEVLSSAAKAPKAHINTSTKFSSAKYGVAASPRLTTSRKVRKGGGRRQVGKPYKIKGKWYTPREEPGYDRKGQASWYGPNFHGRLTANGEIYDQYALSAAHPTFPLPSYARVTNRKNGKSVIVRVNDRGPYHARRIIDLSAKGAELLDYQKDGVAQVRVQYIGPAPLHGLDHDYLIASYEGGAGSPHRASNVQVAYNDAETGFDKEAAGLVPPGGLPQVGPTDRVVTGSIAKPRNRQDFFAEQLRAAARYRKVNTTIAYRLRQERSVETP